MELSEFHFANPLWLLTAVVIPLIFLLYFLFFQKAPKAHQLEKFIDKHLLPHLLLSKGSKQTSFWRPLLIWTTVFVCLTLAIGGPRWTFKEIETFSKDQSLVILLDLSESMNATDIKPSRIVRAKQKIEDLLTNARGFKVGLIGFAADPHMVTPLTEDLQTLKLLLPTLDTDLVFVQGSRLTPALEMAQSMLDVELGNNKAILLVSDGGFEDSAALLTAKKMGDKGISIYTMGIGTVDGAPIKDKQGALIKRNGVTLLSKLEKERLIELSKVGKGRYLESHYSGQSEKILLEDLKTRSDAEMALNKKSRVWDEHFYLFILLSLPFLLLWFRRGAIFSCFLLFFTPPLEASFIDYFKNKEQKGVDIFDAGNYEEAIAEFEDPYKKGVACYKAGNFSEAEKLFRQSNREEVDCSAQYNLGNALVQQQKLKEAIKAYEAVLAKWPDHVKAKENLELVKKMLEEQKNQPSQDNQNDNQSDKKNEEKDNHSNEQQKGDQNNSSENENESEKQENKEEGQNDSQEQDQKQPEQNQESQENSKEEQAMPQPQKSMEEVEADQLLNRIQNDPKNFMKNKFYIESKKKGTTEGIDPW